MGANTPDFSGWATKAGLQCSDGRTITKDAFKEQDGTRVPLVWQHGHNEIANILGHAILTNKDDGVWCDAYFNSTDMGKIGQAAVQHGDVTALSIYANKLVEKSKSVLHGVIREVSLVLAGANPGALIDPLTIKHDDGSYTELEDAALIYTGDKIIVHSALEADEPKEGDEEQVEDVQHADEDVTEESVTDVLNTYNEKQRNVLYYLISEAAKPSVAKHSDDEEDAPTGEEINEVVHSMDERQQKVLTLLVGAAMQHDDTDAATAADDTTGADASGDTADDTAAHSGTEEGTTMTKNVFEDNDGLQHAAGARSGTKLSKDEQKKILHGAFRYGGIKLSEAVENFVNDSDTLQHGVEAIETLFPDAKNVTNTPEWLTRRTEWVGRVIQGTKHVPYSRISSSTANLTLDEARAKGYVKGNFKKEQFFKIAKRKTGPTTIYKKQKVDRDDVLDITDFDLVVWIKGEMKFMLEEEVARAVLLGDGRSADDDDKVDEESIRPIATDEELFVTRVYVDDSVSDYKPANTIKLLVKNRRHYRGTGNPTLFTSETFLSEALLVEDGFGRRLYNQPSDVAAALRVSDIVTSEILDEPVTDIVAIMVNLQDYVIGSDKGGEVNLFDDFDIDYNKLTYLIETRMSGALVKAKSALVVFRSKPDAQLVDPVAPTYDRDDNTVTVAATPGITYRNKATNAVLTAGSPVTLAEGETLVVVAEEQDGYYLESSANDQFSYAYDRGRIAGSIY